MSQQILSANDVMKFWFNELEPAQWWVKDLDLDQKIKSRFSATHKAATMGELESWRESAEGRLAEIIVLDQFSRNIYRDTPLAFACDAMALVLAQEAIHVEADQEVDYEKRAFLYMPYMHSESVAIHEKAVALFTKPGGEYNYEFELKHKVIHYCPV